ncbi:MAG TPA: DUF5995 family protein [Mucilaginibacter sp.]|nr:DUF5995 family protein [Mucilaginibacter sp.]
MAVNTVDEVLSALETIIADSIKNNDRAGYFAALYYKVTASVKEGIDKGRFEDGQRMEKFDVLFANRYLDALTAWRKGQPLSASWLVAFEATGRSSVLVLQQLLLGMNAHINLDLGIAAVEASGGELAGIQKDFNSINTIISALTYEVLNDIDRMSPLLSLLGLHYTNQTSILIQFSIDNARDGAWCFAEDLVTKQGADYFGCIAGRDETIAKLAGGLIHMQGFMRFTVWLIHLFEWKNPARIIRSLHQDTKQKIVVGE